MTKPITTETFAGLAFPVARVRYSSSGWSASIYHDADRTFRARTGYHHELSSGAQNALPAALKALEKALAENIGEPNVSDYVTIPGDFSDDTYTFTFVPAYFFSA